MGGTKISNPLGTDDADDIDVDAAGENLRYDFKEYITDGDYEKINKKVMDLAFWDGRVPICEFKDPMKTPAMTGVTKDSIKENWLGQVIYVGDYGNAPPGQSRIDGRCFNSEFTTGIVYKIAVTRRSSTIYVTYPNENDYIHFSLKHAVELSSF